MSDEIKSENYDREVIFLDVRMVYHYFFCVVQLKKLKGIFCQLMLTSRHLSEYCFAAAETTIEFLIFCSFLISSLQPDVWEQDLSNSFNIDASTEGLQKVQLKCGADSMQIELHTKDDFNGVIYSRGSFYKQKAPCFMEGRGARSQTMKFSFNQCQTIQDGDVYSNVIVVQHDRELVTNGDAAFQVECDFRKPRSIPVGANFQARDAR